MYLAVKAVHIATVMLSIGLFFWRFGLHCRQSPRINSPVVKILPHINDTLLLISGLALIGLTGFIPFTSAAPWLSAKLGCVVAYILFGALAFRASDPMQRWGFFIGAVCWLIYIITLAISKSV